MVDIFLRGSCFKSQDRSIRLTLDLMPREEGVLRLLLTEIVVGSKIIIAITYVQPLNAKAIPKSF